VQLRLSVSSNARGFAVAIILALGGCGSAVTKAGTVRQAQSSRPALAYRVGQYCDPSKAVRYKASGLECHRHHLARG
jgi:hypothetical protein